MKEIGGFQFPETEEEEAEGWNSVIQRTALTQHVLVVAHLRIEGAWCAYVNAVAGDNHEVEQQGVLVNGDKLAKKVAEVLFPDFRDIPYAQ